LRYGRGYILDPGEKACMHVSLKGLRRQALASTPVSPPLE